jgi:16S rRNA (cytidine1402-2'-O)-methyltransferase
VVTDAGTPGVSDPGNILVAEAIANDIVVLPIPGASALASIISVAGIDMQQFSFLGFPPHKKGRETYFKKVAASVIPVIFYESPHRVIKNLQLLQDLCVCHPALPPRVDEQTSSRVEAGDAGSSLTLQSKKGLDSHFHGNDNKVQPSEHLKKIILGRELTKMFEQVVRGNVSEVLEYFAANPTKIKGEFVIVVY